MKAYHVVGQAPMYTNTFLLISDAGHGVVIDPAGAASDYNAILEKEGATLTQILCTHGHFDHVGSAMELKKKWGARLWCEGADVEGSQFFPLKEADSGYEEGGVIQVDEMTFTVWHTPGHTPGASAGPTCPAAAPARSTRPSASWPACPFPPTPRFCRATARCPPSERN